MKKFIFASLFLISSVASADNFNPYNQQFTYNQQFGSTNWYSSPLGQGVAQAGVLLVGGLVNAMSRPDPVIVQQPQQQVQYVNGNPQQYGYQQPQQYQGQAYPQQYGYQQYQPQNYGYRPAPANPYNQYPQ